MSETKNDRQGFKIFRAAEAPSLEEAGCLTLAPFAPEAMTSFMKLLESGFRDGEQIRVLVNIPGFSLTHVWFKKDFPLPLHSHDADCLYYVIAGSLRLGDKTLRRGDGFFLPRDMPYTYRAGPDGVELVEFRNAECFDFQFRSDTPAFWRKAAEVCKANREDWKAATPPRA